MCVTMISKGKVVKNIGCLNPEPFQEPEWRVKTKILDIVNYEVYPMELRWNEIIRNAIYGLVESSNFQLR